MKLLKQAQLIGLLALVTCGTAAKATAASDGSINGVLLKVNGTESQLAVNFSANTPVKNSAGNKPNNYQLIASTNQAKDGYVGVNIPQFTGAGNLATAGNGFGGVDVHYMTQATTSADPSLYIVVKDATDGTYHITSSSAVSTFVATLTGPPVYTEYLFGTTPSNYTPAFSNVSHQIHRAAIMFTGAATCDNIYTFSYNVHQDQSGSSHDLNNWTFVHSGTWDSEFNFEQ